MKTMGTKMPRGPISPKLINPRAVNSTISCNLGLKLDLQNIAKKIGMNYNPKKFSGLVLRYRQPKAAILLFKNGKSTCLGAKSFAQARDHYELLAKFIKHNNLGTVQHIGLVLRNVVLAAGTGYAVNLHKLYAENIDKIICIL